jgi:hypothetical protein
VKTWHNNKHHCSIGIKATRKSKKDNSLQVPEITEVSQLTRNTSTQLIVIKGSKIIITMRMMDNMPHVRDNIRNS